MNGENCVPQKDQLVLGKGHTGAFKVLSAKGKTADIQVFSVSKQKLLGKVMKHTPCSALLPFNASQAAAPIVRLFPNP